MLTERIKSPSFLKEGSKFFSVRQYTYPEGHTEIIAMSLEQTEKTAEGYGSNKLEQSIDVTHSKQKESDTVYYAYNLVNAHVFDEFKQREETQNQ